MEDISSEHLSKLAYRIYNHCDKCGELVDPRNDTTVLLAFLLKDWTLIFAEPRHLIATDFCEGSPSRAQYIQGQPLDPRPEYPYDSRLENPIRQAYAQIQEILIKE